ncbi:hypothetical protein [Sphingosinicella rhizophila]|uniref:DUF883 domain-containing protein n=1 Tax=Sphingosinicella rhizophila TaxID=3050082 RepID=A0ABU3Q2J1_9SPHN|nr:hypothetical protein [Sphingosinicella sp. GR2756]MDT9597624.1 hypothetical protein [Sphingosinicella sp. GR2756]
MTTTSQDQDGSTQNAGRTAGASSGRGKAAEAYQAARERTSAVYTVARERAGTALDTARDGAARARRRTADQVDANPMIAIGGGLALGALLATLLPRTRREDQLLGKTGRRITDTAREATRAAREAGREQLDALGISKAAARRKLEEFTDHAVAAVESSASAAAKKARKKK